MNLKRTLVLAAAATIAFAAILVFAPSASAQGTQFPASIDLDTPRMPQQRLAPEGVPQQITIPWVYSFTTNPTQAATLVTARTTLNWLPPPSCSHPEFLITGSLSTPIVFEQAGAGGIKNRYDGTATFFITATKDAPGMKQITCTFNAKVDAVGTNIPETNTKSTTGQVSAAYLGLLSANIPITIDEAGPQKQIRYDIELTNLGNARSNIGFLLDDSRSDEGWNPIPPNQIILESKHDSAQYTRTVSFLISTPYSNGWNNEETTFLLRVQPVSADEPSSTGTEIQVNVMARVRGIYVPGPEPILLAVVVVGAALVARLRKTE